ncbi:hypothetical protein AB0395_33085 [Streptosporangium sp. NPDC051023]|uniref:hypothetical protein n=1 Tax=Streptosporangium sp. NPDC051023 TaxID=3155410 RepID=UPI00344D861E
MSKPSAPVLDRNTTIQDGCGCFADAAPMPMGCALCGHAPYAHGCPGQSADHDYVQPSSALMNARLEARRATGPQLLPTVEPPADVTPSEVIPLVPAQRRPEPEPPANAPAPPAVQPARPPLPKRVRRPFPRPGVRPAATRPPLRDDGRYPAPGGIRASTHRPGEAGASPPMPRPPEPYGAPQRLLPHHINRTRPTVASSERVLDRKKVRSMENGTSPTPTETIPGWRVIVSDAGRYWASRERPFPPSATRGPLDAPPFRTVDADTFDELLDEVHRQEQLAERATRKTGQVTS